MTECPVISKECKNCDYRLVRSTDYSARLVCQLCANWNGEDESPTTEDLIRKIFETGE